MPKGRRKVEVNKDIFIKTIENVESKGPLVNRSALANVVADAYNQQKNIPEPITFSTALLRIAEWDIPLKTPKGKRGNSDALVAARVSGKTGTRKSRGERTSRFQENFDLMRKEVIDHGRENLLPVIDKIEKGSMKARIYFNCIRCVGYVNKEVKHCTSYACPWFAVRHGAITREEQQGVTHSAEPECEEVLEFEDV